MELYDNPFSPFSFKVRAVLYEKGIECEKREIRRHVTAPIAAATQPARRGAGARRWRRRAERLEGHLLLSGGEVPGAAAGLRAMRWARARARYLELKSDTELDACVFVLGILKLMRSDLTQEVPAALPITEAGAGPSSRVPGTHPGRRRMVPRRVLDRRHRRSRPTCARRRSSATRRDRSIRRWRHGWSGRTKRPSLRQATREMAEGFAATRSDPDYGVQPEPDALAQRPDRVRAALRPRTVAARRARVGPRLLVTDSVAPASVIARSTGLRAGTACGAGRSALRAELRSQLLGVLLELWPCSARPPGTEAGVTVTTRRAVTSGRAGRWSASTASGSDRRRGRGSGAAAWR